MARKYSHRNLNAFSTVLSCSDVLIAINNADDNNNNEVNAEIVLSHDVSISGCDRCWSILRLIVLL